MSAPPPPPPPGPPPAATFKPPAASKGRNDLLSDIRKGKGLKKVPETQKKMPKDVKEQFKGSSGGGGGGGAISSGGSSSGGGGGGGPAQAFIPTGNPMMDEILKKRANLQHKVASSAASGNAASRSPTPPAQARNITPPSGRVATPPKPARNEPVSAPKPSVPPPKPVRTEAPPLRPVRDHAPEVSPPDARPTPPFGKPAAKGPPPSVPPRDNAAPAVPARKAAPPVPVKKAAPLPPARHEVKPELPARHTPPPPTPARVTTQASPPVPTRSEMNSSPSVVTEGRFQFRTDLPPPPPFRNVPKHYKSGRTNGAGTAPPAIPSMNNVDYSGEAHAMLETLKRKMDVHIQELAFEKCSPLRDMIKKIEDQLAKNPSSPDMKRLLDAARNLN